MIGFEGETSTGEGEGVGLGVFEGEVAGLGEVASGDGVEVGGLQKNGKK
jgi:hypothetical protein